MSQEKVLKTLENLGLTQLDARVYIFLAKRGPQKARNVAKSLKMPKQTLYVTIKNLQKRGLITSTLEHPARFSAVHFEKVLDLFVKAKMEEAQRIQQSREKILSDWRSIVIEESYEPSAKFTVIEGRNTVYSKFLQMMQETKKQLSLVTTLPSLVRADQFGLFDAALNHPQSTKIQFRFLTELSDQNVNALKAFLKKKPTNSNFEVRTPELGLRLLPRMIIRDEKETMFFLDPKLDTSAGKEYVCLWTNSITLVNSFSAMFEDLWCSSTNVEKKIMEIETGKLAPKTLIISEAKIARKKYYEILRLAKREVMIMTSSKGLFALFKSEPLLRGWKKKGVVVKLMAPIIRDNIEVAQQLLNYCDVRHVPAVYLENTLVDGQHFFQFKNPLVDQNDEEATSYFENVFYTSDAEYVKKTENMLHDVWKKAIVPSAVTLDSVLNPLVFKARLLSDGTCSRPYNLLSRINVVDEKPLGALSEKEVIHKIINAQKIKVRNPSKEIMRYYGSSGMAIVHPPVHMNLPNMMINVWHFNKQSSFGAEDWLIVYLKLESSRGLGYEPVVFVQTNPNSKLVAFRKGTVSGTPAEQNVIVLKKDELDVRLYGNTLFAGWTIPIPLIPPKFSLPPACIIFEGYGAVKTCAHATGPPTGRRIEIECNRFEAFVTFLDPSSKYSGPGTDGFLDREIILISNPPSNK